jgi:hypothetical protein
MTAADPTSPSALSAEAIEEAARRQAELEAAKQNATSPAGDVMDGVLDVGSAILDVGGLALDVAGAVASGVGEVAKGAVGLLGDVLGAIDI